MKSFFTFFLFLFVGNTIAQVAIAPTKMNVAYIGVYNPLTIIANNIDCDSLRVEVSQGTIEKKEDCQYNFSPTTVGQAEFSIFHKDTLVDELYFRIKRIPDPVLTLGGTITNGSIFKNTFRAQSGLIALLKDFGGFDARFTIKSYELTTCDGKTIYNLKAEGPMFSDEIKELIENSVNGQLFIFHRVKIKSPDGTSRIIGKLHLKIKGGTEDNILPYYCPKECYVFHDQIYFYSQDKEYGKICDRDTISHFIEKRIDSTFIIENQLKDEKEVFQLDEHGVFYGDYEKWENGKLTIDGLYDKISTEADTFGKSILLHCMMSKSSYHSTNL